MIAVSQPAANVPPVQFTGSGVMVVVKAASIPVSPDGRPLKPLVGLRVPVSVALVMLSPNRLQPVPVQSRSPSASTTVKSLPGKARDGPEVKSTTKLVTENVSRLVMGKSGGNDDNPVRFVISNWLVLEEIAS